MLYIRHLSVTKLLFHPSPILNTSGLLWSPFLSWILDLQSELGMDWTAFVSASWKFLCNFIKVFMAAHMCSHYVIRLHYVCNVIIALSSFLSSFFFSFFLIFSSRENICLAKPFINKTKAADYILPSYRMENLGLCMCACCISIRDQTIRRVLLSNSIP